MDRRRFLLTSLAGALAAPRGGEAQQGGKVWRIGFLGVASVPSLLEEFRQGLRDLGYTEGQNLMIEYRFADGKPDRLPALAAELAGLPVEVIVAAISTSAQAAHTATRTIPIVMINVGDPVGLGLAASLSKPGGNVTGTASYGPELAGKVLELLTEIVRSVRRVAICWTPANPLHARVLKDLENPARLLGVQLQAVRILVPDDFEAAFRTAVTERCQAAWVFGDTVFFAERARLASLALSVRLPTEFAQKQHVEAGGLVSYGPASGPIYRRAATYVDKILKGAKPADLPVEQPTKYELVINLKTAKALGLTIPPSVLLRADQVIE
jgi:putative ABC transport system substrate-binding protein